ncbi:MAG: hypothetical protein VZS44_12590 [Bacilli bacterium]|nr:hypothetical protein [Bacilli bacterium]
MEIIYLHNTSMEIFLGILSLFGFIGALVSLVFLVFLLTNVFMLIKYKVNSDLYLSKEEVQLFLPVMLIIFILCTSVCIVEHRWKVKNKFSVTESVSAIRNYEYDGFDIVTNEHIIHENSDFSSFARENIKIGDKNEVEYIKDTKGNINKITQITLTEENAEKLNLITTIEFD